MTFKELLQHHNISGYELAKTSGISQSTIAAWVSGTRNPFKMNLETAAALSKSLGITIDEIYSSLKNEREQLL